MRSYKEIHEEVERAIRISDAETLVRCAAELDAINTPIATATASFSRGTVLADKGEYSGALEHYRQAEKIFRELGDLNNVAHTVTSLGNAHMHAADHTAALSCYKTALALHEELGNHLGVATIVGNIGIIHQRDGDNVAALDAYNHALHLYQDLGDSLGVAHVTGNIGVVHYRLGDYSASLESLRHSLALHEEHDNRSGLSSVNDEIGTVYRFIGDYPTALEYHNRSLALSKELGNHYRIAINLNNIGLVYGSTGDYSQALECFHGALESYRHSNSSIGLAYVSSNIGYLYFKTGDYNAALEHLQRARTLFSELEFQDDLANAINNTISVLLKLNSDAEAKTLLAMIDGMKIGLPPVWIEREQHRAELLARSGDLEEATLTLQLALAAANEHGLRPEAADTHSRLRDLAQKRNDFAGYIQHNNEYTRITEEINGKDTATKLAIQAKQREIDAREREHAQQMAVLHSTLPKHIADRVARGEQVNDHFDNAAVIFLDIAGFTTLSDQLSSEQVVQLLDTVFTTLDSVCKRHDVVKIKTIGDSYMAVAFPLESSSSEQRAASAALDMLNAMSRITLPASSPEGSPTSSPLQVRIGMHCGPLTAGVIGTERMQYDVWGDTVNVASRMESSGEAGRIHVSSSFALALKGEMAKVRKGEKDVIPSDSEEHGTSSQFPVPYSLIERGAIEIKGKGTMQTYWLEGPLQ